MRSEAAALSGIGYDSRCGSAFARIVRAIGAREFPAVAAGAILDLLQFDLAAAVVHRKGASPVLLFHTFDAIGGREGIENYVAVTHKVNPMLARATGSLGTFRARDFHMRALGAGAKVRRFLVPSPDEELGFRTVGWPAKLEEVGVYFEACGGLVEFSFYRERRPQRAADDVMTRLEALRAPLAAAFDRHAELTGLRSANPPIPSQPLSPRETQIVDLLLRGCGSEAIAHRLDISRHTVKGYRKQIFRKLDVSSLAELFALYRQLAR